MKKTNEKSSSNSITQFYKTRSTAAFYACLADLLLAVYGITHDIIVFTKRGDVFKALHYYTVDSNCFNAFVACMILPFAIEGIRKNRFVYPRWLSVFHYSSTFCVTITMMFATFIISLFDYELAFGSLSSIFLHVVCPCMMLISFFLSECGYQYTKKESFIIMIPFLAYAIIYIVNVVFLKRWDDFYCFTELLPWPVSLAGMLIFGTLIGYILLNGYNKYSERRKKKMIESWPDDTSSQQIEDAVYDLGRLNGTSVNPAMVSMNLDLLKRVSDRFGLDLDRLSEIYNKGAIEAFKDKTD